MNNGAAAPIASSDRGSQSPPEGGRSSLSTVSPKRLAVRSKIDLLQELMESGIDDGNLVQTHHNAATQAGHEEAEHLFAGGLYARTLEIPAGSVVIGRIHHQDRICIVSRGSCSFADEHGQKTVDAPYVARFPAGSKTAVYAYTDVTWTAIIAVPSGMEDDLEAVERFSSASHDEYQMFTEKEAS